MWTDAILIVIALTGVYMLFGIKHVAFQLLVETRKLRADLENARDDLRDAISSAQTAIVRKLTPGVQNAFGWTDEDVARWQQEEQRAPKTSKVGSGPSATP